MKKIAIILGIIVLGIGGWIALSALFIEEEPTETNSTSSGSITYTDGVTNATLKHPTSWAETQAQPGTISFAHSSGANVTFVVEELTDASVTLDEYTEAATAGLESLGNNFELLDESDSTTAGYDSYTIEYIMSNDTTNIKAKGSWFVEDGYAYILTYTAPTDLYSTHKKTGEEIIESIKL